MPVRWRRRCFAGLAFLGLACTSAELVARGQAGSITIDPGTRGFVGKTAPPSSGSEKDRGWPGFRAELEPAAISVDAAGESLLLRVAFIDDTRQLHEYSGRFDVRSRSGEVLVPETDLPVSPLRARAERPFTIAHPPDGVYQARVLARFRGGRDRRSGSEIGGEGLDLLFFQVRSGAVFAASYRRFSGQVHFVDLEGD